MFETTSTPLFRNITTQESRKELFNITTSKLLQKTSRKRSITEGTTIVSDKTMQPEVTTVSEAAPLITESSTKVSNWHAAMIYYTLRPMDFLSIHLSMHA